MSVDFSEILFSFADSEYKSFTAKLVPNVAEEKIIGVRLPLLRKIAKENLALRDDFMMELPHKYHEENLLHAIFINSLTNMSHAFSELDKFLPYVDNWSVCDTVRPKIFAKNKGVLIEKIPSWLADENTYAKRFALEMLMIHFLQSDFSSEYLELAASVSGDDYSLKMMVSWYFATALAYRYEESVVYLTGGRLDRWIHNKTIQKASESFRISEAKKEYLKELKK